MAESSGDSGAASVAIAKSFLLQRSESGRESVVARYNAAPIGIINSNIQIREYSVTIPASIGLVSGHGSSHAANSFIFHIPHSKVSPNSPARVETVPFSIHMIRGCNGLNPFGSERNSSHSVRRGPRTSPKSRSGAARRLL